MDLKSSAKSKRAHSLQHKKTPHNPKPQNPQTNPNKSSLKQTKDKGIPPTQRRPPFPTLPSNWDRYDEQFGSDSEDSSVGVRSGLPNSGVVRTKSKGADFAHLISEAQNELRSRPSIDSESFLSFDNVLTDFDQGMSSMLSIRGEGLLSWSTDDNFIVDDNTTSSYEASFLSMDLHALAAQLAKLDVSQRLFIEADLLPLELEQEHGESYHGSKDKDGLASLEIHGPDVAKDLLPDTNKVILPTNNYDSSQGALLATTEKSSWASLERSALHDSVEDSDPLDHINGREGATSVQNPTGSDPESWDKKISRFEATSAEAELDMLLDSFSETKLLDSFDIDVKVTNGFASLPLESCTSFFKDSPVPPIAQPSLLLSDNFDDAIDDLLGETSNASIQKLAPFP